MSLVVEAPPLPLAADDGVVRVGGTRVPLATVITAFHQGATPEEIVDGFDTLELADVYAVIAHYLRHETDVDAYLAEQRRLANEVPREVEARLPQAGLRARLLARWAKQAG